jgi:hypothetical protein
MVLNRLNGGSTVVSSLSDGSSSLSGGSSSLVGGGRGTLRVWVRFEMEGRLVRT